MHNIYFSTKLGNKVVVFLISQMQHMIVEKADETGHKAHVVDTHLLSPLFFSLVLCGLQHFLPPEDKEVGGICVELQCILLVISM